MGNLTPSEAELAAAHFQTALQKFHSQAWVEAASELEKAHALDPNNSEIPHLMALALHLQSKSAAAYPWIEKAISLNQVAEYYNSMGLILIGMQRVENEANEAITAFNKALQLDPKLVEAHTNLAALYTTSNQHEAAIASYRSALLESPKNIAVLINLGRLLLVVKKPAESLEIAIQGLTLQSQTADFWALKGSAHAQLGQHQLSDQAFGKAIELAPERADIMTLAAVAVMEQGALQEALVLYDLALQASPNNAEAHHNRGLCMLRLGNKPEAQAHWEKTLMLIPGSLPTIKELGVVYQETGQLTLATALYGGAHQEGFADADILNNLGNTLVQQGNSSAAYSVFEEALIKSPQHAAASSNALYATLYDPQVTEESVYEQHRKWAEQLNPIHLINNTSRSKNTKLKIGFVSSDLRSHSVAYFLKPLLEQLSRDHFHITAYPSTAIIDSTTESLKLLCDAWLPIYNLDDLKAAQYISEHQIDCLIDLAGHTAGNRLGVFAKKPAPVQGTWLGYPATTGLTEIDFRISDAIADPVGPSDTNHSEQLVRLEHGFINYQPPLKTPEVEQAPCSASNLNQGIVFGSFNNLAKFNSQTLSVWSEILNQNENSVLLLKNQALSDENIQHQLKNTFAQNGISPERIQCLPPTANVYEHLELYQQIDISLDTFPYHGTTTTFEALWMGVPVITLEGNRHASRVSADILKRLNLNAWCASSWQGYVEAASNLANTPQYIIELRSSLRTTLNASAWCNAAQFSVEFAAAIKQQVSDKKRSSP